MKTKTLILTLLIGLLALSFTKYDTEVSYFVQFKIDTISTNEQAMVIDQKMRSKTGIKISRTDYITSTYFCVLKPGTEYTKENFENWFEKLGYKIYCYNSGIQGQDKSISPYILKNCQDEK